MAGQSGFLVYLKNNSWEEIGHGLNLGNIWSLSWLQGKIYFSTSFILIL